MKKLIMACLLVVVQGCVVLQSIAEEAAPAQMAQDAEKLRQLAKVYATENGAKPTNMEMVARLYREAADLGNAEAQYELAMCYAFGKGVEKNQQEAARWMLMAAKQNHVRAMVDMCYAYEKGVGVPQDWKEGARWYEAAEALIQQNPELEPVPFSSHLLYKRRLASLRKRAEQGDAKAQMVLAKLLANGEGMEKDLPQAIEWMEKAAYGADTLSSHLLRLLRKKLQMEQEKQTQK